MELSKQSLTINNVVFDGQVEQPVECDGILPDYCPDILKVLKCAVTPLINSTIIVGDKLSIDGVVVADIYYLTESMSMRHTDYKIPFNKTVSLKETPNNPMLSVSANVDYVNCRAVSSRRLDIRGAISFCVSVISQQDEQIISDASGMGIQLKKSVSEVTKFVAQGSRQFTVSEDLELHPDLPSLSSIMRHSSCAKITDFKIISGKVVVKGELSIHTLYQPETEHSKLEIMEHTLPISQIVDVDDIDDECICDIYFEINSSCASPKQDLDGECRVISCDVKINCVVRAYKNVTALMADDCYSTKYECSYKNKQITLTKLLQNVNEQCSVKKSLSLPQDITQIVDIWCKVVSNTVSISGKDILIDGKINICMFCILSDHTTGFYEESIDFNHKICLDDTFDSIKADIRIYPLGITHNLSEQKLDLKIDLAMEGTIYQAYRKSIICEISVDEEKVKTRNNNKLYIYYADDNETVWDIAKKYNTCAVSIMDENGIEDITGKCMLLIPIKD